MIDESDSRNGCFFLVLDMFVDGIYVDFLIFMLFYLNVKIVKKKNVFYMWFRKVGRVCN